MRGASSSRSRSSGDFMSTRPPPTHTPTPSVFWIRYEGDRLLLRQFNIFDLCWTIKHGQGGRLTRRKVLWMSLSDVSSSSYICLTSVTRAKPRRKWNFLLNFRTMRKLSAIPEYSRIIDYSIIWMCIWCGLLQKLHKIKKSEL